MTGGYGGLGLEAALALAEAGARTVYCLGRAAEPPERWTKVQAYTAQTSCKTGVGRMEYVCADVTDQVRLYGPLVFDPIAYNSRIASGQDVEDSRGDRDQGRSVGRVHNGTRRGLFRQELFRPHRR